MDNKKDQKRESKYACESCDFYTSHKTKFTNHCQTIKHKLSFLDNKWITEKTKKDKTENSKCSCECGKAYVFQSGLLKHKKKCIFVPLEKRNEELKEDMKKLISQNNELVDIIKQNIPFIHNIQQNVNVNNFNIQIFLNEKCKNAISLTDFVESIQPSLTDLEKVGKLGYVEGISSIILTKLNTLNIYQRPIHCSDLKRETLYVKECEWEKDDKKVDRMVKSVAKKNMINMNEWKSRHPNYVDIRSNENTEYLKLIKECVGDTKKIIKNISKDILIN